MRWWLDVAVIALGASWKWLLAIVLIGGGILGGLFAAGVFSGSSATASLTPVFIPAVTAVPAATATPNPTATLIPAPDPTATPPPTPTTVPAATLVVPSSVDVPVYLKGANNVGSLEFVLVYEPGVLEITKVERGTLAGNAIIDFGNRTSGRLWVGLIDVNGINGDGPVAVISFNVVGQDAAGSPLTLERVATFDATTLLDILTEPSAGSYVAKDRSITAPALTFPR